MHKEAATVRDILFPRSFTAIVFISFGLLALLLAVPLGMLDAYGFTKYLAELINFDVIDYATPPRVLALEIGTGSEGAAPHRQPHGKLSVRPGRRALVSMLPGPVLEGAVVSVSARRSYLLNISD